MSLEINLRQSLGIRAARPDFLSPDPDIIEKYFFQFFKSKTLIPDVEDTRKRLQSVGEICGRPSNTVSHKIDFTIDSEGIIFQLKSLKVH